MSKNKKGVSVVIPSFNGAELLEKYLPSVKSALVHAALDYEIIIVDDASTDNTISFIQNNYPGVKLLKNKSNRGFAETINKGIAIASKEILLCLNNDIELPVNFFENQLQFFDREDTFGVMSVIKDINRVETLEKRKVPKLTSWGIKIKDSENVSSGNEPYTFYVCGGNGLFDTKKVQLLGGFSRLYKPFYFEDVDLSVRAWIMGWKSYYCEDAECYHMHSATIASTNKQFYIDKISYRNNFKFLYLFLPASNRRKLLNIVYLRLMLYSVIGIFSATKKNRCESLKMFLRELKSVSDERIIFNRLCEERNLQQTSVLDVVKEYF